MSYPKNTRLKAGYKLYQKRGTVTIIFFDKEEIQAEVLNSNGGTELVSCILAFWRCTCTDWFNRHELLEGAFLCKHCYDVLFEIAYRKFNGLQMVG